MPVYKWEGKSRTGQILRGEMEAPTEDAVIQKLRGQQVLASKVKQKKKAFGADLFPSLNQKKITDRDVVIFSRQFFLVHALQKVGCGLPLRLVHAHVQRAGPAERKTALRLIELDRGDAKIRYASIKRKRA